MTSALAERRARVPVLFVGSFRASAADGSVGGQMFACRALLASGLTQFVQWILIDSTMRSVPPPGLFTRAALAAKRFLRFARELWKRRDSAHVLRVLIFSGDGASFVEKGAMALLASFAGRRVVFCPRSGMILDDLQRSRFFRWFVPLVLRRSAVVICQSTQWHDTFSRLTRGARTQLVVIRNWIDIPSRRLLDKKPPRPGATVNILYMGWLEPFKGVHDLLEAVVERKHELGHVHIAICGDGSQMSQLRDRVRTADVNKLFEFRGWVKGERKLQAFDTADLFVLPSLREGLPNALLEAMAYGLPVVASRVGGIPDVVCHERNGLLFDAGDRTALGDALVRLSSDVNLLRRMGVEARNWVADNHDISRLWPEVSDCLQIHDGRSR